MKKAKEMDDSEILSMVAQELSQSVGGTENDFIEANRQAALATYLGQPNGKEVEGRSKVTSTDVADAIEWIMPEIVKSFTQNNEVVTFDPCYAGDEDQAELESKYVYDILMKDNNGFLIIHQFVKDALMQKNGFVKAYYEEKDEFSTERYTGLTSVEYQIVVSDPNVEVIEQTETMEEAPGQGQIPIYDIKVRRTLKRKKINIVSVPPEEFRINKMHNSVDVSTARFTAHVMLKTVSDLIQEGYDRDLVESLAPADESDDDRDYRFYMQGESTNPDLNISGNHIHKLIEIAECYTYLDMDGDGIDEMVKVTVAGGDNPDQILDIEEIDENPFISATAILMSHKLFGLSIYDRLKEIQEQKTTLWRNILDNMYFQNNQRTVVVENQVNLDDLMVSRPGGIIRAKRNGAVEPFPTPQLPQDSYKMMDYLDQVRSGRVGVSPEGPITDSMIGDRVGSEGVERMMSQKEELVGLMVRVFAETGIKPLCSMIRRLVIKHQDVARDYMFRGQWIQVDPRTWRERPHTTVRVGTGSGNRKEQQSALGMIFQLQEKIYAMPGQSLLTENQIYSAINDFAKFSGLHSASSYFLDPKSPEGQQNKQQVAQSQEEAKQQQMQEMQQQAAMAQAQVKIAEAEQAKVQVQAQNNQLKAQNENLKAQLEGTKIQSDNQIKLLKQQLDEAKAISDASTKDKQIEFQYWDAENRHEIERQRLSIQRNNNSE